MVNAPMGKQHGKSSPFTCLDFYIPDSFGQSLSGEDTFLTSQHARLFTCLPLHVTATGWKLWPNLDHLYKPMICSVGGAWRHKSGLCQGLKMLKGRGGVSD